MRVCFYDSNRSEDCPRVSKRLFVFLLLSCCLITAFSLAAAGTSTTPEYGIRDKTPNLKAFINARIFVSPGTVYDSATLIIEDDHVRQVGQGIAIPAGADTIDLKGNTVYPGFIDPFTDYGVEKTERSRNRWGQRPQYEAHRVGGSAWNEAIHSEKSWVSDFEPGSKEAETLREQGFTVVQSVKQDGILRGRAFVATLGEGIPNDLLLRPYARQCASFDKGTSKQAYPESLMGAIALLRQTFYDVNWYERAKAAYKLNPDQEMPEFNSAIEALANVGREGLLFESNDEESLLRAERVVREFDIPTIHIGSGREYDVVSELKGFSGRLILPVDFPEPPEVNTIEDELSVSLAQLRHWERAPSNPEVMAKAGISFAFTTHRLKKPKDFLDNVRQAIKRGLSEQTALAALTTVPAKMCGLSDRIGALQPGMLADFLVCDGDIFADDATLYSVWIQGSEYEIEPIPEVDFRGKYDLSADDLDLKLDLTGKLSRPKGEFTLGEQKGKLESVSAESNKLEFALKLDTLNVSGMLRFSGRLLGDTLAGDLVMPDGAWRQWRAVRTEAYVPKPDTSKAEPPVELVSRQTYPNKAYGFESPPKQTSALVRNATIWTSEDAGILENSDLLVVDGKIAAIGQGLTAPQGAEVIDGTGKHVTAGIIDAHSHIAIAGDVNEGTEAITSEARIKDVVNPTDIDIYRQLAAGVTASHILHGSANPIGAQVALIKLRWGSDAQGLRMDAPPTIKFALGENVKQSNWGEQYRIRYPQTRMGVEAIIRDAFQAAKEYQESWDKYDALSQKLQDRTIPPRHDLELQALADVLAKRMYIACHAYVQSEMLMLVRLTQEYGFIVRSFEHGLEGYKIAPELAKAGVGVCTFPDWWAYKFEVYDAIPQNASLLTEAGVTVAIKSDSPEMARRLPQEAAKSIMYTGLSQEETIKHVTINPAKILMVADRIGSLKVGKDGDFVIWNGNPLSIYSRPEQTWIEGAKYFDRQDDLHMREELRAEKSALIQKILSAGESKDKGGPGRHGDAGSWHDPGTEQGAAND